MKVLVISDEEGRRLEAVGRLFRSGAEVIGTGSQVEGAADRLIRNARYDVVALDTLLAPAARSRLTDEISRFLPRARLFEFETPLELLSTLDAELEDEDWGGEGG